MSVMMTVLLTFMNMSADNEIIALKAGGVSIYRLLPPVLLLCLIGFFLTGWMAIYGVPWGKTSFKQLVVKVAASNISIGLKERVFNDSFKDVVLYVQDFDIKTRIIKDIFIEDRRTKDAVTIVLAPKGVLISDPETLSYILRLYNGDINQVDIDEKTVQALHFNTYDISLDMKKILTEKKTSKSKYEMSLGELENYINTHDKGDPDYFAMVTMYYEKFSVPFACFVLGLIAMPLGLQSVKKTSGLNLGIIFFMIYYLLLTAGWSMCKSGAFPPLLGMWLPNIIVGITAIWFLVQTSNERSLKILQIQKYIRKKYTSKKVKV